MIQNQNMIPENLQRDKRPQPASLHEALTEDFLQKSKDMFYLFPPINRLPNQSQQRAHSDAVTPEHCFRPLLEISHLCFLPLLDLSSKSQGYKLLEIRTRYCSCLPQQHIWLKPGPDPSPGQTPVACFQRWGCGVYLLRVGIWNSHAQVVAV